MYNKLRFRYYADNAHTQLKDMEDVDLLMDGTDGIDGSAGRAGAAIRGPYDWADISGDTRYYYAGEESIYEGSEKWIDVILKDGVYYYCTQSTYFDSSQEDWSYLVDYFQSGETMNFVAANLLLADTAKIKFQTGNQIYMEDSAGTITAGVYGGNGSDVAFWAGNSEANPKFSVDHDGKLIAKEGRFYGNVYTEFVPMSKLSQGSVAGEVCYEAEYNGQIIADIEPSNWASTAAPKLHLPIPTSAYYGFTYTITSARGYISDGGQGTTDVIFGYDVVPYSYGGESSVPSNQKYIYDYTFTLPNGTSYTHLKVKPQSHSVEAGGMVKICCMPFYDHKNNIEIPVWGVIEKQGFFNEEALTRLLQ